MMAVKDELIAARKLIEKPENWRKDAVNDQTSCCAVIACNRAGGRSHINYPPAHRLAEALPEEWLAVNANDIQARYRQTIGDEPGTYVGEYNDDPTTTHNDILALFDRAIQAAEA